MLDCLTVMCMVVLDVVPSREGPSCFALRVVVVSMVAFERISCKSYSSPAADLHKIINVLSRIQIHH